MTSAAHADAAAHLRRIAVLDVVKGIAIAAMVVYHFSWDLSAYGLVDVDVATDPAWKAFARSIAGTFLLLVGINLVLAGRNGFRAGPYFRRLAVILAAAALVTIGTFWLDPSTFVFFGILHAIFVASILALPFIGAPLWAILAAAVVFLAGPSLLVSPLFDAPGWYWLGLSAAPPRTVDYVPIFPWFGVVLIGVVAGRLILAWPALTVWRWPATGSLPHALAVAGRWSLPIYLIHQPVLIGGLMLAMPLLGPSEAALSRQLVTEYEASCAAVGYAEPVCEAYAGCILTELGRHENILADASRRALSKEQLALWQAAVEACREATLAAADEGAI